MSRINKILVIRLSSLGDIILSFPLLKKIKEKFPEAELHYLSKETYRDLLNLNPHIDKILTLEGSLLDLRKNIKESNYDLIIDAYKNFRSIFISYLNAKLVRRISKDNIKKYLLVKFKIDLFKEVIPVYRKYLLIIKEYLYHSDLEFTVSALTVNSEIKIKEDYIVIAPSSKHFTKTYPKDKFVKYIKDIQETGNQKFILVGDNSEKDKSICKYISEQCEYVTDMSGLLDMNELAGILLHSKKIITNDSAILHFGEALGKGVVALFGSTVKQFGFFPQLKESEVFEIRGLNCRPCTHIGRESCPKGHFKCMEEIQLIIDN